MTETSNQSIISILSHDFPLVYRQETVNDVYGKFRQVGLKHKIIYLYVVDENKKLLGVLPIRRLLVSQPDAVVGDLYLPNCITLSDAISMEEAREAFVKHKFLAFPVVDKDKHMLGVLDIEQFAGDLGDLTARSNFDEVYEIFGLKLSDEIQKSPFKRTFVRLPWLLVTMSCGLAAAFLTGHFETTLSSSIYITFFVTLVLGLNESIAMQSATLAVHKLHSAKTGTKDFLNSLGRELFSAFLLGATISTLSAVAVSQWSAASSMTWVLCLSLSLTTIFSCFWGVSVPYVLHALKKDPKVAIGPLVLGLTDLSTLSLYFFIAKMLLG